MKRPSTWRVLGLSAAIGLGVMLTACNSATTSTPASAIGAPQPVLSALPAAPALAPIPAEPTATMAQPTATSGSIEAVIRPTLAAPACQSPATPTLAQTEGPYYKPNSPERASLIEPGMSGTKLIVTGYVFTTDCQPVARAWLDFWQADDRGAYDNTGFRLRGHLFTDEQGRYQLETIFPGEYPGRTQHIHVKVRVANGPILTTQIYFPGEPGNERDSIFDPALLAAVQDTADGKIATFNFVVPPQ